MAPVHLPWKRCVSVSAVFVLAAAFGNSSLTIASSFRSDKHDKTDKSAKKAPVPVTQELPVLPLDNPARRNMIWLTTPVSTARQLLIHRVEEKFASGEQNYKAGHLEAARKDFDDAVDLMLQSGYDVYGDAKLSELFHRVVGTVYAAELQAFRAGDGFQ